MATSRSTKPMCCVTVGFQNLLMPADEGLKLLKVLQSAVACDQTYLTRSFVYVLAAEPLRVEMCTVQPNQVRQATISLPGGDQ